MKLPEYVKQYRKEHKLSVRALADRSNCSFQYISKLENGEISAPSIDKLQGLAKGMGMSVQKLLEETDDQNITLPAIDRRPPIVIPLYAPICCGNGGFDDDNITDTISLPYDMMNPNLEYFAQRASGDSMIGAGIHPGDLLIFQKTGHIENGKIGCFCIDDNLAMCKTYHISQDGEITLYPANDLYDPIHITDLEHFRCIGILAVVVSSRR